MLKDIPFSIPKTSKNDLVISSNYFINFIKSIIIETRENIEIEKMIAIENDYYDIKTYKNYNYILNLINDKFNDKFIKETFWKESLNEKLCDFKHKGGKLDGLYCCRKIYIESLNNYDKYMCSKHIRKDKHIVKKNNIKLENKCIDNNKYGDRCNLEGKYEKRCIYHYKDHYKLNSFDEAKTFYLNEKRKINNINDNTLIYECKINKYDIKKINILEQIYKKNKNNNILLIEYPMDNINIVNNLKIENKLNVIKKLPFLKNIDCEKINIKMYEDTSSEIEIITKYIEESYIIQYFEEFNDIYNYVNNEINKYDIETWPDIIYNWKEMMQSTINDFYDIDEIYTIHI